MIRNYYANLLSGRLIYKGGGFHVLIEVRQTIAE